MAGRSGCHYHPLCLAPLLALILTVQCTDDTKPYLTWQMIEGAEREDHSPLESIEVDAIFDRRLHSQNAETQALEKKTFHGRARFPRNTVFLADHKDNEGNGDDGMTSDSLDAANGVDNASQKTESLHGAEMEDPMSSQNALLDIVDAIGKQGSGDEDRTRKRDWPQGNGSRPANETESTAPTDKGSSDINDTVSLSSSTHLPHAQDSSSAFNSTSDEGIAGIRNDTGTDASADDTQSAIDSDKTTVAKRIISSTPRLRFLSQGVSRYPEIGTSGIDVETQEGEDSRTAKTQSNSEHIDPVSPYTDSVPLNDSSTQDIDDLLEMLSHGVKSENSSDFDVTASELQDEKEKQTKSTASFPTYVTVPTEEDSFHPTDNRFDGKHPTHDGGENSYEMKRTEAPYSPPTSVDTTVIVPTVTNDFDDKGVSGWMSEETIINMILSPEKTSASGDESNTGLTSKVLFYTEMEAQALGSESEPKPVSNASDTDSLKWNEDLHVVENDTDSSVNDSVKESSHASLDLYSKFPVTNSLSGSSVSEPSGKFSFGESSFSTRPKRSAVPAQLQKQSSMLNLNMNRGPTDTKSDPFRKTMTKARTKHSFQEFTSINGATDQMPYKNTKYSSAATPSTSQSGEMTGENSNDTDFENTNWAVLKTDQSYTREDIVSTSTTPKEKKSFMETCAKDDECKNNFICKSGLRKCACPPKHWYMPAGKYCESEIGVNTTCQLHTDSRGVTWMRSPANTVIEASCPSGYTGTAKKVCSDDGRWQPADYHLCERNSLLQAAGRVRFLKSLQRPSAEDIEKVVSTLSKSIDIDSQSIESNDIRLTVDILSDLETVMSEAETDSLAGKGVSLVTRTSMESVANVTDILLSAEASAWNETNRNEETLASKEVRKVIVPARRLVLAVDKMVALSLKNQAMMSQPIVKFNVVIKREQISGRENIYFPAKEEAAYQGCGGWVLESPYQAFLSHRVFSDQGNVTYGVVLYKGINEKLVIGLHDEASETSEPACNALHGKQVMTDILSFSLSVDIPHLSSPLNLTFPVAKNASAPTCGFLHDVKGTWSDEGCQTVFVDDDVIECHCDHMTNFAVLMSPAGTDLSSLNHQVLSLISIVGCSLSIACLVITILAHVIFWRHTKSDRAVLHLNLSVALILVYIVFMTGINQICNQSLCTAITALLHYLLLVVFFIMLAELIDVHMSISMIFDKKSILGKLLLASYLLPALIVSISLSATQAQGYRSQQYCWLSVDTGTFWAFAVPALVIILINVVQAVLVMKTMMTTALVKRKDTTDKAKVMVRAVMVLSPLLGVTWVFGILAVNNDTIAFQYLFALCNSLQGVAIFIFYCLLSRQVQVGFMLSYRRLRARLGVSTKSSGSWSPEGREMAAGTRDD